MPPSPKHKPKPLTPAEQQHAVLVAEIQERAAYLVEGVPQLHQQAKDMGRGYPSGGTGVGGPSRMKMTDDDGNEEWVDVTSVERQVLEPRTDPADEAREALAEFAEWLGQGRRLERRFRRLLPLTKEERARLVERQVTTEFCESCTHPIVGQIKRLDNKPYHPTPCFWAAYNRTRGRRAGRPSVQPDDESTEQAS